MVAAREFTATSIVSQHDSDVEEVVAVNLWRRAVACAAARKTAFIWISLGTAIGYMSLWASPLGRYRAPITPLAVGASLGDAVRLPASLPKFPLPFPIPSDGECGAARCAEGDLCCPGGPGYGFTCGTELAVCCQGFLLNEQNRRGQVSVSIVCAEGDVCCVNAQDNPYCCASGNICKHNVCVAGSGQCFPAEASVETWGKGRTTLADVQVGDKILVHDSDGTQRYETVDDFLHADVHAKSTHVTVMHEEGEFRASESHTVYVSRSGGVRALRAADVQVGDHLQLPKHANSVATSKVVAVQKGQSSFAMYAPLTASGRIVVDGVLASVYAMPQDQFALPPNAMHVATFLTRAFYILPAVAKRSTTLKVHNALLSSRMVSGN
eukprot:TRINITY_DN95453_c0_g1_i1.p1 TRINITY_DN95453_c0_g1~~TRINITY_DN95453_c0_g1_i1.p1  ORF type:complete len:381 (-),score=50.18 TRINITY_DN95453_c0_g1_i1:73-1215(-)